MLFQGDLLGNIALVGECLQFFVEHATQSDTVLIFEEKVKLLMTTLETLPFPNTLGVSRELKEFGETTLRKFQPAQSLQAALVAEFSTHGKVLRRAFYTELKERQAILVDESAIPTALEKVPVAMPYLSEAQQILRAEAVRSLRVENYRSAIVMTWAFAYDYIRTWIFSNHKSAFNTALTAFNPKWQPIVEYADFWNQKHVPGEWAVLEVCESAGIIRGKPYDALCEFLRTRNNYAHPNFLDPDADLTKGYIAALLHTITYEPFPKPSKPLK
jgi:hypothetical protein